MSRRLNFLCQFIGVFGAQQVAASLGIQARAVGTLLADELQPFVVGLEVLEVPTPEGLKLCEDFGLWALDEEVPCVLVELEHVCEVPNQVRSIHLDLKPLPSDLACSRIELVLGVERKHRLPEWTGGVLNPVSPPLELLNDRVLRFLSLGKDLLSYPVVDLLLDLLMKALHDNVLVLAGDEVAFDPSLHLLDALLLH